MTTTPSNNSRKLSQQLKIQTGANRYTKLVQDNGKRLIDKILNK
jgi:hypothetical protein